MSQPLLETYLAHVEAAIGQTARPDLLSKIAALSAGGSMCVIHSREEARFAVALAALQATDGTQTEIHVIAGTPEDADLLTSVLSVYSGEKPIICATAESLIFDYLKGNNRSLEFALCLDAERTLLWDEHTPVILSHPLESAAVVSPDIQERADRILVRGRDYEIKNGEVVVRDPESGQLLPGRRFSNGLHAAVEQREGIPARKEGEVITQITVGDYFRKYGLLGGVALAPDPEFESAYGLSILP